MANPTDTFEVETVALSRDERRALFQRHGRVDTELREVWDEASSSVVVKEIPLPAPICMECREVWGSEGCTTVRTLTLLAIRERTIAKNERRIAELNEAVSPRFGVMRLREPGNRSVMLRMEIDQYTLIHAGMPSVDAILRKMHDEFRVWFKKIGDLERLRADHLYALTLDSDYYVHLSQSFDPWAPFVKAPGAPWDDQPLPIAALTAP